MPQTPHNTISQTELKHYNQLISITTEAIRCLKIKTDTEKKINIETESKERDKKLLYFITMNIIKVEEKEYTENDIITFPMDTIINSSFNINHMLWEIIHCRLLHPSESVMKEMCHHQTLTGIPKHFPKNINEAPCTVHFRENGQFPLKAQLLTPLTLIW